MTARSIGVLLPVHNGEATLAQSIESLLGQTHRDFTVLVIDDGSTDATPDIISRFAKQDSCIQSVRKSNSGLVDTLNVGIDLCPFEFVARQDADDLSAPNRFETQLRVFEDRDDVVAVSGAHAQIDASGAVTGMGYHMRNPNDPDFAVLPHREPYLPHPFLMMRRVALQAVGGRYRYVIHAEDTDLYWRLHEVGALINTDALLGHYRIHDGSLSSRSTRNGRLQATYSQLAGLSAARRWQGLPDLCFPREALEATANLSSLEAVVTYASAGLDAEERALLRAAAAAKFLELLTYRPYPIDRGDIDFIGAHLWSGNCSPEVWSKSASATGWLQSQLVKRLWRSGARGEALRAAFVFRRNIGRELHRARWFHQRGPALARQFLVNRMGRVSNRRRSA